MSGIPDHQALSLLSVMMRNATAHIKMVDISQSLRKKPAKSLLFWRI
jgi:aromatic ring-opening dioxygenase catalytic subunit (LigB family)